MRTYASTVTKKTLVTLDTKEIPASEALFDINLCAFVPILLLQVIKDTLRCLAGENVLIFTQKFGIRKKF